MAEVAGASPAGRWNEVHQRAPNTPLRRSTIAACASHVSAQRAPFVKPAPRVVFCDTRPDDDRGRQSRSSAKSRASHDLSTPATGVLAPASTNHRHPDRPLGAGLGLLLRHPRGQQQKCRRRGRSGDEADALADCSRERPLARRRLAPRRRGVALGASRSADSGHHSDLRCWSSTVATCASPTLVMRSATKGARQPKAAENAAVDKVGNRRDAVARESQHEHSDGVRDRCLRVSAIAAECWLAVGSGWDQLVAAPAPPI